jgi:hypothetical protein|tara:strand:- start:643 stop:900 length:258 start_codon:yes stop_codon:yes gene_type:complete
MKELNELKDELKDTVSNNEKSQVLNKENLLKYVVLFAVVTLATLLIPTCGVLKSQAVSVGLVAATTFATIDMVYPHKVYVNGFHP